jgi:hypothetical protein
LLILLEFGLTHTKNQLLLYDSYVFEYSSIVLFVFTHPVGTVGLGPRPTVGRTDRTDGRTHGQTDGRTDGWIDGRTGRKDRRGLNQVLHKPSISGVG